MFLIYFLFSHLMDSTYSPNDYKSRKTMMRSYFYETHCYRSLFSISSENFNLELNHVLVIKFAESCRAGGKWAQEEHLQKN